MTPSEQEGDVNRGNPEDCEPEVEIAELAATLPDEAIEGIPTDGASQHDHYLYGSSRKETP